MSILGKLRGARTLLLMLAAFACHGRAAVAENLPSEQEVRAAMVFNFIKFSEFAPEAIANSSRLRLCIAVGDTRQAEALAALSGRKVWGRELVVVRLAGRDDDCQVLYVDTRQHWSAAEELRAQHRTLTISAYRGFAQDGGMIEIALQEDGARFEINLAEGRRAGIHFAPQLLRLARQIHE
jgi:hypothetical protein